MSLIFETARSLRDRLVKGEITTADLLDALEARIAEVDGPINALPTLCFDRARAATAAPDSVLAGMPVAIKDTNAVEGVRSTWGSPIYADHVPAASDHVTQRIEENGGVVYAKSNVPEFAAGSQTFNPVFGPTCNPWNLSRTVGGSSGGSGAALVSGQAWLAQGSDMGGSLRNPASFCGCVGLRPTAARVPGGPSADCFSVLGQQGPMARNIGDVGLFLDAMAGANPAEPFAQPDPAISFREAAENPRVPKRIAYSPDFGVTPVDPEVRRITEAAARRFEKLGAVVEEASPDFTGLAEAAHTLRGIAFATTHYTHYRDHKDKLKPDIIWNIEHGQKLTGQQVAEANIVRNRIARNVAEFFQTYDLLLGPAAIVPPFPVTETAVMECDGVTFETYIDWMMIMMAITLSSAPALSLPCGFTDNGLPIGLQMVGPIRGEVDLLSHAAALEAELGLDLGPIDPRPGA